MAKPTRSNSKHVAIGVALLSLAGSLLAVDVVTTHAANPAQPQPVLAETIPVIARAAIAAPHNSPPERATFATTIVRKIDRHVDRYIEVAHVRPLVRLQIRAAHRIAHDARHAPSVLHRSSSTLVAVRTTTPQEPVARPTVAAPAPRARAVATPAPRLRAVAMPAPRATGHPAQPVATHSRTTRRAGRSSVEAAQYFAVRTVEAQTHGLEHVAAVTHKRGVSRLVVYIIAKTHAGTLVEYEVLRKNGIGFAIESRTTRFVAGHA